MRASCTYRLIQHPRLGGGGYCIGGEGDTFADLVAELRTRYGSRLLQAIDDQTGEVVTFSTASPDMAERLITI